MLKKTIYSLLCCLILLSTLGAAPAASSGWSSEEPEKPYQIYFPAIVGAFNNKACLLPDMGGINDKTFNASAWDGMQRAAQEFGIIVHYIESQSQTDYEKNMNAFLNGDCDLIVPVGFLMAEMTRASAEANPNQRFAIVDVNYEPPIPNLLGLIFDTHESAFLAGYLAAGMTKTGKVATYGGLNIPPVTDFMDGFYQGVIYYNKQKGTVVQVLGWDPINPSSGLFTGNFESIEDGRTMGSTLLAEGADIIMPVAGPVGLGTAEVVKASGNAWIIGVDTDWTVSAAAYKDVVLTSVIKDSGTVVYEAIKSVYNGSFKGGTLLGTLANGGVDLGTTTNTVPAALETELAQVRAGIIAGDIPVDPTP